MVQNNGGGGGGAEGSNRWDVYSLLYNQGYGSKFKQHLAINYTSRYHINYLELRQCVIFICQDIMVKIL